MIGGGKGRPKVTKAPKIRIISYITALSGITKYGPNILNLKNYRLFGMHDSLVNI